MVQIIINEFIHLFIYLLICLFIVQVDLQMLHVRHSLHPADFALHTLRPAPFQSESVSLQMSGLLHALRPEAAHAGSYQGEDGKELGGVNGSLQIAVTFFFF